VLQFVPCCPLKNEKGLRQHPFAINHYSPYNLPIGFYGNDSPARVPRLPAHLISEAGEPRWQEGCLCGSSPGSPHRSPRRRGTGALAGRSPLGPAKVGSHLSKADETTLLARSTPPKEKPRGSAVAGGNPIPKKGYWEEAPGTLQRTVPVPVRCPGTITPPEISKERGLILLCSPGSLTPRQSRRYHADCSERGRCSAPLSLRSQPRPCPLLPLQHHLAGGGERFAPPQPPLGPCTSGETEAGSHGACLASHLRPMTRSCCASFHSHLCSPC